MRTVRTVAELRAALSPERRAGRTIGLVPTMGALHDGHLSLLRSARERCDVVVMSLFVNPAQFGPGEDLIAYPRDEARDAGLAAAAGADVLFAPEAAEVYPDGFATRVSVTGLTEALEGAHRGAAHFHGVTTVVTKLFNMAAPHFAFFGQKDAQQAVVLRRLARDLDFAVEIEICPTVRDADGLALSSRNAYLAPADRARALGLSRALLSVERAVAAGERDARTLEATGRAVLAEHGVEPEYFACVSADTLRPLTVVDGPALVAVAAQIGPARLIDNTIVGADVRAGEPETESIPCNA